MKNLISEVKTDLLHRDCTLNSDSVEKRLIEVRKNDFLKHIEQEVQSLPDRMHSTKFNFLITSITVFPHTPHLALGSSDGKVHIVSLKLRQITYSLERLHNGKPF
jgi:WD40 repeat protein